MQVPKVFWRVTSRFVDSVDSCDSMHAPSTSYGLGTMLYEGSTAHPGRFSAESLDTLQIVGAKQ